MRHPKEAGITLLQRPRSNPEDVFLVGEELTDEDAVAPEASELELAAQPDEGLADGPGGERPADATEGEGRSRRLPRAVGVVALGLGVFALAAVVIRSGGEGERTPPISDSPTSAQLREQAEERLRERRQERRTEPREQRARERREAPRRRETERNGSDAETAGGGTPTTAETASTGASRCSSAPTPGLISFDNSISCR